MRFRMDVLDHVGSGARMSFGTAPALRSICPHVAWRSVSTVLLSSTMIFYVMVNAYWEQLEFHIQEGVPHEWQRIVDTSLPSPNDISDHPAPLDLSHYVVAARSIVVLLRPRP
jgi:pullulanase/glycogen debranching enzyme